MTNKTNYAAGVDIAMERLRARAPNMDDPGEKGVRTRIMQKMLEAYGRAVTEELDRGSDHSSIIAGFMSATQYVGASALFTIAGKDPHPLSVSLAAQVFIAGFTQGFESIVQRRLAGELAAFAFNPDGTPVDA